MASTETDQRLICVVEIPKGSRNKYEDDPDLGAIVFDRLLMTAAVTVDVRGWRPREEAVAEIEAARERFEEQD